MDKNEVAVSLFNKHAKSYEFKYMDVSKYGPTLDLFCSYLNADQPSLLDLACGPGNVAKHILEKHPEIELLGMDLSEEMIKIADSNNPSASFEVFDCRLIGSLDNNYNGILCAFLLPYLSKEQAIQLIADSATILHDNGLFYISTMEDDYNKSALQKGSSGDELFMYFHQADYLIEALEANNLKLVHTERVITKNEDGSTTTDLILVAKKG